MAAEAKIKAFLTQQKDFTNIQYILCNFKDSKYTPFITVELLRKMYTEAIVAQAEKFADCGHEMPLSGAQICPDEGEERTNKGLA